MSKVGKGNPRNKRDDNQIEIVYIASQEDKFCHRHKLTASQTGDENTKYKTLKGTLNSHHKK
jgi:hypothetical protein